MSTFLADSKNIFRNSSTFKIISVGVLILLLLIPASMVQSLIAEREYRRDAVVQEINQKWGNDQLITGPFISIPFRSYYKDKKGELLHTIQYIHVLPESLDITGKIEPHVRYRSLFEAVLYNGKLDISGSFTIPSLSMLNVDSASILWHKAVISLGISDMRGIQEEVVFTLPHTVLKAGPGLLNTDIAASGVHAVLPGLSTDKQVPFSFAVNLNGSEQLQFVPVGESNTIAVQSNWKSPSFNGEFLPYERNITQSGFDAKWKVLHLNRNYPQYWVGSNYSIQSSAFGLKLILTADVYQKSTRLAKYAIMFLVFTFAAFFFSEVITKQRIHPIQYIFIGIGILIFYTLVLALSEHIPFNIAYLLSAVATTVLITGYAKAVLCHTKFALTILGLLGVLYCYLFVVLQLEDYALLLGSVGLFVVLACVMYVTRSIDWYQMDTSGEA